MILNGLKNNFETNVNGTRDPPHPPFMENSISILFFEYLPKNIYLVFNTYTGIFESTLKSHVFKSDSDNSLSTSLNSSVLRLVKMLHSGAERILKDTAQWWFSKGDMSLYLTKFIRDFKPGNMKSCFWKIWMFLNNKCVCTLQQAQCGRWSGKCCCTPGGRGRGKH